MKNEGKDVVNFGSGEPDFDTPEFIKSKATAAIKNGFTKYTPTAGTRQLKEAICAKLKRDNGLNYEPSSIIASNGAKHSIFNTLFALVEEDEEVIIPSPYWVSYPQMVYLCNAKPRIIETKQVDNFKIAAYKLKQNINPKTKVLILNTPNNPTGAVYSLSELQEIAKVCVEKNIFVIADEIYEKLIYDDSGHISIAGLNKEIYNRTITVNGLSKSHAMTGWRIGYLAGPAEIVKEIAKIQDHTTSCPSSISQEAALAAIAEDDGFSKKMRQEFRRRRDYLIERLKELKQLDFIVPRATFYLFCNIKKTGLNSTEFVQRLLNEQSVLLTPGIAFGDHDYVRFSFATSMGQIEKGMDRIEQWLRQLQRKS